MSCNCPCCVARRMPRMPWRVPTFSLRAASDDREALLLEMARHAMPRVGHALMVDALETARQLGTLDARIAELWTLLELDGPNVAERLERAS